jgi:PHD/YefM family antitoxin component YafN of YafNO toxin-antitoxin module
MSEPVDSISVTNAELATVRAAMRDLTRLIETLDEGTVEKIVLTQRNQMRAVLLTVERYSELERAANAGNVNRRIA